MTKAFTLFSFANRAVLEAGTWLLYEEKRAIKRELKMFLKRAIVNAENFEKDLHKNLGPELAKHEDEMNTEILAHVERIFNLTKEEQDSFFDYMEKWEPPTI
jgi:hypothetical protein